MKTQYFEHLLDISDNQKEKIKHAINSGEPVSIRVDNIGDDRIALTQSQINKIIKGFSQNKAVTITLSKQQLKYNRSIEGGFIGPLLGLAARFLPAVASKVLPALGIGAVTGLAGNLVNKVLGNGMYLHTDRGDVIKVKDYQGSGLILKPQNTNEFTSYGKGLYIKKDGEIFDGSGILSDLTKSIPLLNLII